jgi:hypothetical protein
MLDEADIKASRLAAPKEAVGRAVVKAVKKDRIQLPSCLGRAACSGRSWTTSPGRGPP